MTPTTGHEPTPSPARALYRKRHRLTHNNEFQSVFNARLKKPVGPLVVFALPNDLGHPRLGLSVGKRVGGAVKRNAVKRRLRDAFRHLASNWPESARGLDLVIVVRPHEVRRATSYQSMLQDAVEKLTRLIEKRDPGQQS